MVGINLDVVKSDKSFVGGWGSTIELTPFI